MSTSLSDEKHVLQGLTNMIFTLSHCVMCVLNVGKMVFAICVVKLQSNSYLFIRLIKEFGLEGELLFMVIRKV